MIITEGVNGDGGAPLQQTYLTTSTDHQAAASKSGCARGTEADTVTEIGAATPTIVIAPLRFPIQVTQA